MLNIEQIKTPTWIFWRFFTELPLRRDDNEGGVGGAGPIFSGTGNFNHFTHKPILALQVSNA